MTDFRPFAAEDAIAAAASSLSLLAGEPVRVELEQSLGDEKRRNLILRARAYRDNQAPQPIIIKSARAGGREADGFIKQWAAATYLARHAPAQAFAPALLVADTKRGVLVYEDLGVELPSLVTPLLHGTAAAAEQALTAYAESLAAMHHATIGCGEDHATLLREGFPSANLPPFSGGWIEIAGPSFGTRLGGNVPDDEMELVSRHVRQPGSWQVLVHGDPCPDNVVLMPDGRAILVDFEFARPGHALLDAAYWRFGFPTCWCVGIVPIDVSRRIDAVYRRAIADAVPAAMDDAVFRCESAIIDVAWAFDNLGRLLVKALPADEIWGRATKRSRIVTYLERAIRSTEEADILPRLRANLSALHDDLRNRWPDTAPLPSFPAFEPILA